MLYVGKLSVHFLLFLIIHPNGWIHFVDNNLFPVNARTVAEPDWGIRVSGLGFEERLVPESWPLAPKICGNS
jgi:hypothetical protein